MAVLGFGLALIAAGTGASALVKISNSSKDINERIEKNASLELEIKKLVDRADALEAKIENAKAEAGEKVNRLAGQTQSAVNVLNSNINQLRDELVKDRESIAKLATVQAPKHRQTVEAKQPKAEAAAENNGGKDTPAAAQASSDEKTHKIQSGDTFQKLAKKYSVSVEDIIKANPDANPSRLKIGQLIKIPAK